MTTTYIQIHGARLRWTKRTLEAAGVAVHDVQRGPDGLYYLAVNVADAAAAARAMLPIENYVRRAKPRKPMALRLLDVLLVAGLVAAGAVALVAPLGGAVVLAWLGVTRLVGGKLHENAAIMHQAGGRYRLYAIGGMALMLLLVAGFIAAAGGMAAVEIAGGNSALKLLQVQP